MKNLLLLPAFVCVAIGAFAQNWATVSAANITDLNQQKLAAGQLCFLITDQQDNPISVQIGGGGQSLRRPYCAAVTNGSVTAFTVPNPAMAAPSGIYYRVTARDTSTGQEVLRYTQVTFSGATFNLDNYAPLNLGSFAPLAGTSVSGNLSVTGNVAATGTVTGSNIPGNIVQTIQSSGVAQTQRAAVNFMAGLTCADNAGSARTDCRLGTFQTVAFSATPVFDASAAIMFKLTLTGNVTSSTLVNAVAGQPLVFEICQDAIGGRTFVPPANVLQWSAIPAAANTCSAHDYVFDGSNAVPNLEAVLPSGGTFSWNGDTGLSRLAAGTVAVGNGTQSNTAGTLTLSTLGLYTNAQTLPANIQNDTAGGIVVTSNSGKQVRIIDNSGQMYTSPGGGILFQGATSGFVQVAGPAVGGTSLNSLQPVNDTFVYRATTDTLTNKTIGAGGLAGLTTNHQIFTASGTFTIPAGVTSVKVTVVGGGGAGGGATTTASVNGTGGGSGGVGVKWLTGLTPGNALAVTVGTGGAGVANASGGAGNTSSVGSGTQVITTISALGGGGGTVNAAPGQGPGAGTGGDINIGGNVGTFGIGTNTGGNGAPGLFGGAGPFGTAGAGNPATGPGAGGGGAGGSAAGNAAGGSGANGIVIFEWTN